MGWPTEKESFISGKASDQAVKSIQDQGATESYAYDKFGVLRPFAIRVYEQAFALSTDYDLYIDHGQNIDVDDVVFANGAIRGYNQSYPPSDQNATGPDGIIREWMEFPSFGSNNNAPVSVSVSNKYLHVRRVTTGTPSIISTARVTLAYFVR